MAVGTVCWFDEVKGYGFIRCPDEEKDLFVHYTGISGDGYKTLKRGWVVNFTKVLHDRGRGDGEDAYIIRIPEARTGRRAR